VAVDSNPCRKYVVHRFEDDHRTGALIRGLLRQIGIRSIVEAGDGKRDTVLLAKGHSVNGYPAKPVSLSDLKTRIDAILKPEPA
jgi:hypothetical protein